MTATAKHKWSRQEVNRWNDIIDHFEANLDARMHNAVKRSTTQRFQALVIQNGRLYDVVIPKSMSFQEAVDCLIHEWAHLLSGFKGGDSNEMADHDDSWGIAYATVYRAFLKWTTTED